MSYKSWIGQARHQQFEASLSNQHTMFASRLIILSVSVTLLATFVLGQNVYDVSKQQCCDGTVHDKKRGLACCGSEVYSKYEVGCCGNQTVDFPDELSDSYDCCLDVENGQYTGYKPEMQRCCNGKVLDVPDTKIYYACCGTELFNYETHTCCGDQLFENDLSTECCGSNMVSIDYSNSESCCGDEVIDTDKQMCCSKYHYDNARQTDERSYKVHDKTDDNQQCCGLELYDYEKEICCSKSDSDETRYFTQDRPEGLGDDEYPYCCGEEVIVSGGPNSRSCCYGSNVEASYDMENEQCCGGTIKPLEEGAAVESCCWSTGEFYDAEADLCTAAGVRPINGADALGPNEDYCVPNVYGS